MRKLSIAVGIAVVLVVSGVVQGQGKTDPVFNKFAAEWAAAYNAKDAAKLGGLYAEDAVYMPPDKPMVKGRPNIEAMFKTEFQGGFTNMRLMPIESAIAGSQGFEAGTATVTAPGGRVENGKYLVVFKRVGSDWKIAYDINNTDQPAAPTKK